MSNTKPAITIDLIGPSGNVFEMRAIALKALSDREQYEQAAELRTRFDALARSKERKTTYQDMRNLISEYCSVVWLNETEGSNRHEQDKPV